jgi:Flp pilus assembly pilin Flp
MNGTYSLSDVMGMREKRSWAPLLLAAVKKVALDEDGGEVLEYALIAGLIVVAAMATIHAVGTKVVAKWTSLNSSM